MMLKLKQTGATLFVALMFLLIMTLFAVSSVNLSTVNLRIVGNMQAVRQMEALAQEALEYALSDSSRYGLAPNTAPPVLALRTAQSVLETDDPDSNITISEYTVTCLDAQTATGYSAAQENIIPEDTNWEIEVTATDNTTGASITLHQGIGMRMLAGNCN